MPRSDQHFAKRETIAVFYFLGAKAVLGAAFSTGINLRRFKTRAKLARTADQIGMDMRFEDMRDSEPGFACHLNINLDVGSRIENRSDSFVVVTQQVRKFGDAFGLNCFKN
jgi:hypothetical protein